MCRSEVLLDPEDSSSDLARQTTHPLSQGQRALWYLHLLAPESGAYHVLGLVRVRESLDPAAVERSFRRLAWRHAALRSTFQAEDGEPQLQETDTAAVDFAAEDASSWSQERIDERLREETYRPFDLEQGPLLRVRVFRAGEDATLLLVVVHHIVADFWSFGILLRELGEVYREETGGSPAALAPLHRTFADFARREAAELAGPAGERLWDYWRERLGGALPVLELPTDRPRPPVQTFAGAVRARPLDAELVGCLRALGRAHRTTLFATLHAGFQVLLHRLTGQEDVLVGSPAAGRPSREWADLVGYFVNPVVLRGDLSGDPPFSRLLERSRETAAGAFEHQAFPFPLLAERLQPVREPSRSPVFQVMFSLQKVPVVGGEGDLAGFALGQEGSRLRLGGLVFDSVRFEHRTSQFDLSLLVAEGAGRTLWLSCQYNTDLFDGETVERWLGHLERLLRGAVEDPSRAIGDLPLLSEAELHQVLSVWNDTGTTGEPELLHAAFERQAALRPEAVALIDGQRVATYGELAERSGRIAGLLRRLGVGPEVPVGICMERSLEMVESMLGILRAGGAYLPLDPSYPAERRALLAQDADVPVVITRSTLRDRVPEGAFRVVEIDREELGEPAASVGALPGNLAYLIYTSGSTGRPKGVAIEHRSACALVRWSANLFSDEDLAAVLASTSINFDLSVFELFVPLSRGGAVVLAENALALPRELPGGRGLTLINTVPSALAELVRSGPLPPSVRTVNLAGEPLRRSLADQAYAGGRVKRVFNLYGPSEDTTYSTWELVPRGEAGEPTLGRPIAGTRAYVLDRALRPVPPGSAGEALLAGEGLTRGYLGRPDLTAERFVPDPFGAPGERLYRTGDLVRQRMDGRLELLGRIDHQVKVRGFRIELGEVETALDRHPGLRESVVVALPDASGVRSLVAYVVPARPEGISPGEIRSFLRERLPEPMVPSLFLVLPELPRTPNGKVDRRALPSPESLRSGSEGAVPRTPTEELVAGVWAEVLGRDRVGIDESFFDLGGHSLAAARVAALLSRALGRQVPLREVLRTPTVAGLAAWADAAVLEELAPVAPPPVRSDRARQLPASFSQERLWFLDQLDPGGSTYTIAGGLRLRGRLATAAAAAALATIVERHEALRTTFGASEAGPVQWIAPAAELDLPVIDLAALPGRRREEELARRAAEEARQPFDLGAGPLLRTHLVRLAGEDHALLVSMHHIVSDGWSLGVFVREFAALYGAALRAEPAALPPLPIQYADFAVWQRERFRGGLLEEQLAWWRQYLAGAPQVLELPADRPRPAVLSPRGAQLPMALPDELSRPLFALCRREGATPFMALLAAFAALLSRSANQEDLLLGSPVAGRNRLEAEPLIGLFINTVVLRTELGGEPGFRELLGRLRESALGAYAHQDIPFERLVEELAPERDRSRTPLFQVMLSFQRSPVERLGLPGLDLEPFEPDTGTAKFDLTLALKERDEDLRGYFEYSRDLFEAATVERLAKHFLTLLAAALADPSMPFTELPLLDAAELEQLLSGWNDTGAARLPGRCLGDLFEEQARKTPEALALAVGAERLRYRDLEERSGRLARHLAALGVGPEVLVGVCARRTADLPVALLAVLRAGGAYVPLDPAYPEERLALMLEGCRLLLAESALADRFSEGIPRLWLDDETLWRSPAPAVSLRSPSPSNLAYVIYTSGSTGRPKGVAIEHRSAAALIGWAAEAFSPAELSGMLAATSVCFDLSVFELFAPLSLGGSVILADNALALPHLASRDEVTLVNTVPSAMAELVRAGAVPAAVRTVVLAGEPLRRGLAQEVLASGPERLLNAYGPSEDTTYSTASEVERGPGEPAIGRPLPGSRAYVQDSHGELTPVGVPGELLLGGAGLARGYLGRPELTAERFVPDGWSREPGARLYRTGDLVRWRADGELEFLGRIDHQVKVRGFRIELGEVEVALRRQSGVRDAVVVAAGEGEDKRLVGYVAGEGLSAERLRDGLSTLLPGYMVPAALVLLAALPLTPNGKVDRKALPAPQPAGQDDSRDRPEPRGPVEELLAGIWQELLGSGPVGRNDNFFHLGGHSLLVTRLVSRVREAFGVDLRPAHLFETPTLGGLAREVASLSRSEDPAPPIQPVSRQGGLPLSFSQERLWFLDQLEPGGATYTIAGGQRLRGRLDPGALAEALAKIVDRHEALRTTFCQAQGRPTQRIAPAAGIALPVVDLAALPVPLRDEELARRAVEEARRPFDLATGPLLRTLLVRLEEREHALFVSMHHIISDGWSLGLFVRELAALYGRETALPALPVQYADFAAWQREWLRGEVLERHLAWWRERLAGAPQVLELPADRPRPAILSQRGAHLPIALPADLSRALLALSRREGATPFMTLLAGFSALLSRLTGQEDLLLGSPVAGRDRLETEPLIGFFVNTLVLRAEMGGEPRFLDLLARLREMALGAFAHQALPFERLVEELSPERDRSRAPLFQVMLGFQRSPMERIVLPGLDLEPFAPHTGTAKFDLTLSLEERGDVVAGWLEYSLDLFEAATIARWAAHLTTLLEGIAASPEQRISDLPLLSVAERSQILEGWNTTATAYPWKSCVPELFAAVARERSEAPAIVAEGEVWTYRRLDEASNRLARHLRRLGVSPGTPVGISLERSPALILGTLAILKAGGFYVPLDASYPDERLGFMQADTGAGIVLVQEWTRERWEGLRTGARLLPVDGGEWQVERVSALGSIVPPESLAYVIYTSGSTGRPKGVAVPHRAIVRLVRETDYVRLGAGDRVAHLSNTSFDAATFEIWGALLNGGAVVVIPREVALVPAELAGLLKRERVTAIFLTTALFNQVVREAPGAFSTVRHVLFGGEAVDPGAVARALAPGRPERLLHVYGPTESTTFATWHPVEEVPPAATTVPIGIPLANTTLYVLDRRRHPVPPGVAGELFVGGDGLAHGYWNRPELTAERFVPHPWGVGERLYRTGDLVRHRRDGAVEFLGRVDDQVKIRGFRIEPGEVEAVLAGHPAVREAVVLAREVQPGGRRLVAWVVLDPASSQTGLRSWLQERLPDYMVPSAFVALESLPLTPNGKVDRRALPDPVAHPEADGWVAPSDPIEELLAGIWAEVLGCDRVGVHDDFFALGGHSLLATRVVSQVRDVLGVELPLRELFESPTVAELASAVRAARSVGIAPAPRLVPVPFEERPAGLPLSFAQQRLWLADQLEPGSPIYNIPVAVRLTGEVAPDLLARVFTEVVRRHEALRTTFQSRQGNPVQTVHPEPRVALPLVDLRGLPEGERDPRARDIAREEVRRPFDLCRGPLLRLLLMRLGEREHLLVLTMHHIVSDGWSMGVLLREMGALQEAFSQGAPSPLPELPVQYADFALWQRRWLQGEVLEEQLGWWRRELAEAPASLDLPADRLRSPLQSRESGVAPVGLDAELTESVRQLSRREGATPFMVLLAAYQALLSRFARQADVLVGTPVANRNRSEIEGLIGFFVNTLVLRGRLGEPGLTFRGLLAQTRETALGAFAHQDLPFERLVEELGLERDLSVSPLFQVFFALQNVPIGRLALPGLTLEGLPLHTGTIPFDLSLELKETGGEVAGTLEYSRALFDAATASRLRDSFVHLLRGAAADPERRLAALPLLGEEERQQLLREWIGIRTASSAPSIVARFESQVDRAPDAPALFHPAGDVRLTYAELDRLANRLARRLRRLGVGTEARVAVLAERSPELIVSFLGILKAGGVYVPLDPAYPPDRLAYMLEDSAAAVLLTQERLADRLPAGAPVPLFLDGDAGLESESDERLRLDVSPDQLAYMIYTSGSTGRPKGVMVPHGAIAAYAAVVPALYGLGPGDRVLQFCSPSFDVSVDEIVSSLCGGAELVLRTDAMLESVAAFLEACRRWSVTVFCPPTAYWHEIAVRVDADGLEVPSCLRLVVIGGERALRERVVAWRRRASPQNRLVNCYGVTEATIMSTLGDLGEPSAAEARGEVSMGSVMPEVDIYLLDPEGEPVPPGVAGEIQIGGPLLARGYNGRPELTAERFVPHPFSPEPGARLYRTGDLARALPDGELEFVGRGDRQVKVRGYRIEVEEIEARLLQHPEVESAVVLVLDDPRGDRQLAGYVVPRREPVSAADLRAFLREALPDPMVPAAFVTLDALPLTPNGKIDRRALPEPGWGSAGAAVEWSPEDPAEEILAAIWAEVLRLDRVSAYDDFFALGGHSLLATQVVSRIREALGVDLPLRTLFESPTVIELARAVREARSDGTVPAPPLARLARQERLGPPPLSFAQQRLWFLEQLEPGGSSYIVPGGLRLRGRLNVRALAGALAAIVGRHEALRTTFATAHGLPVQLIAAETSCELPILDLGGLPEASRDAELARQALEDARRPFDLGAGPLLRALLVRLADREHALLLTMHHIVSDGWSLGVFVRELAALYRAASNGEPAALPDLPVQYADYAVWQRTWLQGPVLEAQLDWWRERLSGAPQVLELPADRPRPAVASQRGANLPLALPEDLGRSLLALSRREGATPFMTLLAGFATLLSRLTGQEDLLLGSPVAGRSRLATESLIGFFVNTLVLRAELGGEPGFRELLARVRETALGAFAHQDLPFERLVEELAPERDRSRTPLFQVMFVLQRSPLASLALPGLELDPFAPETGTAKFDLTLALELEDRGATGSLEYSTDLFEESTVARWAGHFINLLEGIAADPEQRISQLPLLSVAERVQILEDWSDSGEALLPGRSLGDLFEEQAKRTPEALALTVGAERLRYRDLEERSGRLARHLAAQGVGPEVLVGVCARRTADLPVALLAVLRAGGTYVPLDPAYPEERLALMLEGCRLLITESTLADRFGTEVPRLWLDDEALWQGRVPAVPLQSPLPSNLAYVIYTSGSTGRPKGVAIEHRSAAALIGWAAETFSPAELSGMLAATSVCFDLSVFELFAPLSLGGSVILADNALALPHLAARDEVTLVNTVPSAMAELVRGGSVPASVRTVVLAGEPLRRSLAEGVLASGPERLLNAYGPSEDTTYSTASEVETGPGEPAIGRPLPGSRAHVQDSHGELTPVGVPGELLLGGAGLARGYLGRPELTAERFVPDGWSREPGARLYRTGDLVRWRADGELEFLGRIDHQVKVRGFRIELGEIEAALRRQDGVHDAVVVATGEGEDKRLVGYVVGEELNAERLRDGLAALLPGYMIPSVLVLLKALPLTPNGKVDRRALPAPQGAENSGFEAPQSLVEQLLAAIWEQLLGVERVGRGDNFFHLGGHSLLATRLVSRLREALGVELPLAKLFDAPTLESLAREVELARCRSSAPAPPIRPVERQADLPLSFAQERLWFLEQLDPGGATFTIPGGLRLRGRLDVAALGQALAGLVARHETLRTTFAEAQRGPVQRIAPEVPARLPLLDLAGLPEELREQELARQTRDEASRPFDLSAGPLLRTLLVRLGELEHALLVTMHHVISDGWSMGIFLRELAALYAAARAGEPAALPPLPVQYADYAVWQRQWFQGEGLEGQLAYWRRQLADPAIQDLPTDRPRPETQSYRGSHQVQRLSPVLLEGLGALGRREGTTLFMTLLAALEVVLHRHTGETDLLVGIPIAGRVRAEVEGLIGIFLNTLVLRTDLGGDPPFHELLRRLRETALGAYAHQDLPFEKILAELQPQRDASRTPYFQVFFNLLNLPEQTIALPQLEMSPLPVSETLAKFDLGLYVSERSGALEIAWAYNADLFDGSTILRLTRQYEELLEGIVSNAEAPLSRLPLLPASEAQQLLVEWNDSATGTAPEEPIHREFERRARRSPAETALIWDGGRMDCGTLNRRANRLARELRAQGVGPENVVALCLDRSPDLVMAILAVLKAGAAFLPLDAGNPAQRLEFLMTDAQISRLLTTEAHLERLPAWRDRALDIEREDSWAGRSAEDPEPVAMADNIAYVIYTSGSTGQPKGAMITHRTLERRLLWMQAVYQIAEGERVLHKASTGFDVAVWETLWPLRVGATVVVARPGGHQDASYLHRRIVEERINLVHFVPSMLELFLAEPDLSDCGSLRIVLSGGEPLSAELLGRCRQRLPGHLYNQYGMTEACIDVTYWSTRNEAPAGNVPIGRPYGDTAIYLLDKELRPVPLGAVGDLWVGGDEGLLRGYRGSAERTVLALAPDPFGERPGARLYRTGDRARRRPDGTVVYLGRGDNQIKLRGLRVAPEEIEGALRQSPQVEQAAVVERDQRLVAYIKPASGLSPASEELRQHLRSRLPEAMIPSVFVTVDVFPKTPSGKLDRLTLKRRELPRGEGGAGERSFTGPSTPFEALLAEIWSEVLGIERIGVEDNFFELGGHSLFAAQVVARLRQKHGVSLPLRLAFQKQTVAELAREVERRMRDDAGLEDDVAPIAPSSGAGPVPLTLAQKPFWLDRHMTVAPSTLPIVFALEGELNVAALRESFQTIVERHSVLRTSFGEPQGEVLQFVHPALPIDLPVVDLASLTAETQRASYDELLPVLLRMPWDLEAAPLFRTLLLRLATDRHVVVFLCHHILLDGWSGGIFLRELEAIYRNLAAGRPAALPPLGLQYRDFALWQHRYLQGETARAHQAYWRRQLEGFGSEATGFPPDRPAPARPTLHSDTLMPVVPPALLQQVRELSAREGKTLFMVILAAIKTVLFHHTGRPDLAVMSLYANRHLAETEDLIGNFYTFLPLRTRLSPDQSFRDLLASVQEVTLGGYTHSDGIPEEILRRMWARRGDAEPAISRVLFALQNLPGNLRDFAGLKIQALPADSRRIRFDTSFFFYEGADGLFVRLRYSTELFDEESVRRWYEDFVRVLEAAVEEPARTLAELLR